MFIVDSYSSRLRVRFQSNGAITMNLSDRLTFCMKVLNIFEEISAWKDVWKKLGMECLGDKCHVCAFSFAQKASRGLSSRHKILLVSWEVHHPCFYFQRWHYLLICGSCWLSGCMHTLNWILIFCLMWCVSLKSEKAKKAGNVLTTIVVGEFLEKKVVARLVDGVDLQWEPLILEVDDHVHTFFSTLSKSTKQKPFYHHHLHKNKIHHWASQMCWFI